MKRWYYILAAAALLALLIQFSPALIDYFTRHRGMIAFDDTPPEWTQLPRCVFIPTATIFIGIVAVRVRRWLVWPSLAIAWISARAVLHPFEITLSGLQPFQRYDRAYHAAVWFSALLPIVVIAGACVLHRQSPNKSVETTRGTQP